jgi:hypothetical protein
MLNLSAKGKSKLPKKLKEAFEKTEVGETIKTGLELNFSKIKFFPAQGEKTNIIIGFNFKELKGEKDNLKDNEKKDSELKDVLAIRIINKKKKKEKVTVFAQVDNSGRDYKDSYYFEIQAKPGEYEIIGIISTRNLKKMGSQKIDLKVPDMFPDKVALSSLVLYKNIKQLDEAPIGFKVYKNSYPMGMYMVYPLEKNIVESGENPRLLYFIIGAKTNKLSRKYQLQITYRLLQGEKVVEKYKPVVVNNTVVDQPLPLIVKGEKLAGKYSFEIEVMDIVSRNKTKKTIELLYK